MENIKKSMRVFDSFSHSSNDFSEVSDYRPTQIPIGNYQVESQKPVLGTKTVKRENLKEQLNFTR